MAIELNDAQKAAVNNNGNILVAAAAGSGKTAVLVERVIKKLCSKTDAVSADRLLIVTFTNAAAAEMRGRIERRLDEECRNNPEDSGLLLQKHLLGSANICTIDSFCIDLVRENFEKLGISPDFQIVDEENLRPINERVLTEVVRPLFERHDPVFYELLDIVGTEYDQLSFYSFVLELYRNSRFLPFPKSFYKRLADNYCGGEFSQNNIWRKYAFDRAFEKIKAAKEALARAIDLICGEATVEERYYPVFKGGVDLLCRFEDLAESNDWDGFFALLNNAGFDPLPGLTKAHKLIDGVLTARGIYKSVKNSFAADLLKLFCFDSEEIERQFKKLYPCIKLLSEILIEFDDRVFEALKEENTFTFHHTESMALSLLCEEGKGGAVVIKDGALEFLDRYDEVCVDEYQDTNDLQNRLFYVLSNRDSRLFAVGDLKQSIYGFRGANPGHFLEKKNAHILYNEAGENDPKKIILSENYRSKSEICRFVNYVFGLFMTEKTGDVEYNREETLLPAGRFPQSDFPPVNFDIIVAEGSEEDKKILEARQISRFIKRVMSAGNVIREDENTLRPAKLSDFAILLRGTKTNGPIYAAELRRNGIAADFSDSGFCEQTEISVMLSLLKIIDNPVNDIELLGVMMSPIFGFSAEELAVYRTQKRKGSLYSTVTSAASRGDRKAEAFIETLQKFRMFAVTDTIPKLIDILLEETGLGDIVLAYPDGERRYNNLRLLAEYAASYATGLNANISGFIKYIEKRSQAGIKSAVAVSGEESVKIMTVHSSKGLQFPVCILADTTALFSNKDSINSSSFSAKMGLGFRYFDEDTKLPCTSFAKNIIVHSTQRENLSEELRLLYVALTRTQDILYTVGTVSKLEKQVEDTIDRLCVSGFNIDMQVLEKSRSYFKILLTAMLLHPNGDVLRGGINAPTEITDSRVNLNIIEGADLAAPEQCLEEANTATDGELVNTLKANYSFKYPFADILETESKASVSALANKAESEKYSFTAKPSFMSKGGITATGRGTAMHKVMEFFDFSKWENPEAELERLYEWQFLSQSEYESVDKKALEGFFAGDIFRRILRAKRCEREMRFITRLPATEVYPDLGAQFKDESIIVQGAVDICFEEEDGVVILDFKTDRTDNPEDLKNAYAKQLEIYALACRKIFEKPVKAKIIYSFALEKEIYL